MKKLRIICLLFSVLLIVSGLSIQVYLRVNKDKINTASGKDGNIEYEETNDIFDANNISELNTAAQKSDIQLTESPDNKNELIADGYNFGSEPMGVVITKDDSGNILKYESKGYLFAVGENVSAADYKDKVLKKIDEFAKEYGAPADMYQISELKDKKSIEYDIDKDDSYQAVIDGKASLSYYIKTSDGSIAMFRSRFEPSFRAIIFELYKFVDKTITQNMRYDVDLSQTTTEGQGE